MRNLLTLLLLLACLLSGCRMDERFMEQNGDKAVPILRYDRLQSEYVRFNSLPALQRMNTQHPQVTQILIEDILALGQVSDDNINVKLQAFYSDTTLVKLMEDIEARFADLSELEKQLGKGFKKLHKAVPELDIPKVYTQVSALNESIIVVDSLVGISLDKYMGTDYPLYERYYYKHQLRSMRPDRIAPDCFSFYLMANYPIPATSRRTLLDIMIHFGKINYVVKELMGYATSEETMGYSDEETLWCVENKEKVWQYMLSNKQLHTTDPMVIRRYTRPMPQISFFGPNSPGLIGTWMGMEIVTAYMKHNKKVTLNELLHTTNYELMLEQSGFAP